MSKGFIACYQKHLASFRDRTEKVVLNIFVCAHTHTHTMETLQKTFKIFFGSEFSLILNILNLNMYL